jgi:hypothetical protein
MQPTRILLICLAFLIVGWAAAAQFPTREREGEVRLPSGKLQSEEILKADHAKSVKEVAELQKLVEEVRDGLDKNDRYVLDLDTLKKLEQIEKLAKRIRGRLNRN